MEAGRLWQHGRRQQGGHGAMRGSGREACRRCSARSAATDSRAQACMHALARAARQPAARAGAVARPGRLAPQPPPCAAARGSCSPASQGQPRQACQPRRCASRQGKADLVGAQRRHFLRQRPVAVVVGAKGVPHHRHMRGQLVACRVQWGPPRGGWWRSTDAQRRPLHAPRLWGAGRRGWQPAAQEGMPSCTLQPADLRSRPQ